MERKLLLATDGSVYSFNAIHYLSRLFTDLEDINIHLLSIVHTTAMQGTSRDWVDELDLMSAISSETRKKLNSSRRFVNEASLQLSRRGIAPEQITTEIKLTNMNVHGEIIHAARKGLFDAVVIGRQGKGQIEKIIMGSTSSTLLEKCHDVPIWIIDGRVNSRTFLLPVDNAYYSLRAADHLGFILKDNPYAEITLFHSEAMFSESGILQIEECYKLMGKEWCDKHYGKSDDLFHAPRQILVDHGFPEERIHTLQTKKGLYPSRQIVRQALIDNFGTIVMGRRGEESVKGIFKGTSSQVIAMAQEVAIWIVG